MSSLFCIFSHRHEVNCFSLLTHSNTVAYLCAYQFFKNIFVIALVQGGHQTTAYRRFLCCHCRHKLINYSAMLVAYILLSLFTIYCYLLNNASNPRPSVLIVIRPIVKKSLMMPATVVQISLN